MTVSKGGSGSSSSQSAGQDVPADPLIGSSATHVTAGPAEEPSCSLTVDEPGDWETFPVAELGRLDDMINRPRWVIPVLPRGELEVLLDAAVALSRRGIDQQSEACQRFYRDGLTTSFTKILTDEAVTGWKLEIHRCILSNCEKLIELIVLKLPHDCLPLLDLLSILFTPNNKFHQFISSRPEAALPSARPADGEEVFAKSPDPRAPRHWLVDLINKFGRLNGFAVLLERIQSASNLTIPVVSALIRPFGLCHEFLTLQTIERYFMPIIRTVPKYLESLTDEELKKESKNESKNDAFSAIIKSLRNLSSRVPNQEELIKNLEVFRLGMILKLLKISSFNGKMNALNEVNKVISNVSYFPHRHSTSSTPVVDDEEWLTAGKMAQWLKENDVLKIVLRDSLHQPQYVEKLEKIIRFVIKEKSLTLQDLDDLWNAQAGKHEAIVKNVHDLLAKLAWDFTPEQLDHLFGCFQASWREASKKQREKLLELIRRLAEDDKDGVMAHKVLNLLWNLAHNEDVPNDIMDQALAAHVKILDYSCSQDRDTQKTDWLEKCIEELKTDNGKWVLPALKQMKEICCLYNEAPPNYSEQAVGTGSQRTAHLTYRHQQINKLQSDHTLVILVSESLSTYMNRARVLANSGDKHDPNVTRPGSRFSHVQEVQERLNFLRFLLKDGQLWMCAPQAKQIWKCLAENAVYPEDREACFKWFSQLMTEEPDLDPDVNKYFFENNILQLDPILVTESGIECFDRFFKAVNVKEGKLVAKRRSHYSDDLDLIGLDYLWKVVLNGSDDVSSRAIELLKETFTNLGPKLQANQVDIHEDMIASCVDRLRAAFDTISVILTDPSAEAKLRQEVQRMTRVLKVMHEYISQCDNDFGEERTVLPMARAFRGVQLMLTIKFPNQGRQMEDIEIWTHANDTLYNIRRQILAQVKASNAGMKVDLYLNGEMIDPNAVKLVSQLKLKDKAVLTGKLYQVNSNMPSSPDSSSDSSTGSPHNPYEGPNPEAESCLPGVILSKKASHAQFLFQISDLGMKVHHEPLVHNALSILRLMPADQETIKKIREVCGSACDSQDASNFDSLFLLHKSPTQVAYNLIVIYSLLMPAQNPLTSESQEFQFSFIKSGCGFKVIELLTRNNFLSGADDLTKICTYYVVLQTSKLVLVTLANYMVLSAGQPSDRSSLIEQALCQIPNPSADCMIRDVAKSIAHRMHASDVKLKYTLPDRSCINSVVLLCWATATGQKESLQSDVTTIRQSIAAGSSSSHPELHMTCKEALEVLTVMFMLSPDVLSHLFSSESLSFPGFVIDLVLICSEKSIRSCALDQLALIATKCSLSSDVLVKFIELLYSHLSTTVAAHFETSNEFFQLFCRLLNSAAASGCSVPLAQDLLEFEIDLIQNVRTKLVRNGLIEDIQLEGHLGVTKETISLYNSETKHSIGCDPTGKWASAGSNGKTTVPRGLIKSLMDEYIFPASRAMVVIQRNKNVHIEEINPICSSPATLAAAFDVLVALCTGCINNLQVVSQTLTDMFYTEEADHNLEWEYQPPVGPRPCRGFVGLKNAGATCYMNSVLQQLYMIPEIRDGILSVDGAINDPAEDFSSDDRPEPVISVIPETPDEERKEESRKDYNLGVLKYVQAIFGHLALSKLQYYVPRGFWRHFKLWGEPVNLREQHDALEFFNSLVDSLDEALKSLSLSPVMSRILAGSFADQKICKDCPHRYSREEGFTTLNIDIRNHSNLLDSLEQYVKGDLLEGANAYHCEKCNRKVDTVKRLCIKKLPPVLAIQLKRFDYDWERETAIKFNDYFEFPRVLDMEPYTVRGLAKMEGELIDDELVACDDATSSGGCTKYDLTGIVVHSGQASGGHYYSYILYTHADGSKKWYKFDDGDVAECKLDDEEEMRVQCFGGEYVGEVFDHMLKRMSSRRQKRWWNAYILVYRRQDTVVGSLAMRLNELTIMESKSLESQLVKIPAAIQRSVQVQNIKFMHTKNQFSTEYFQFMKKLLHSNGNIVVTACPGKEAGSSGPTKGVAHEIALTCTQLAARFLFSTCFHTKKSLRGPATEWYEVLSCHLRLNHHIRAWFASHALISHPYRFCDYLLESPATDVRSAFSKIIVFICHFALQDNVRQVSFSTPTGVVIVEAGVALSDMLMTQVLKLLSKEVSEHSRHLAQYFGLFATYAGIGPAERTQLLKLNVAAHFITISLDEGPGPPIKYQYADFSKLFQVVSILVRSCDVSAKCSTSSASSPVLPNPFGEEAGGSFLMPLQSDVEDLLYKRPAYIKKLIEDANSTEDTAKLFKFCCWENPNFSSQVLSELLWQIAYSYAYELRPHLDLLLQTLLIEDSWQEHRIHNALKGMQDDREGMFDTIIRNKSHYQKRAYQCIKCLVTLFSSCTVAHHLLKSTPDFKSKWEAAITWLQEELDRRPFGSTGNQYNYNWSPPAPSNDSSNGYYLERSQSARITLSKAVLLIPEEEKAAADPEEVAPEEVDSPAGSSSLSSSQSQVTVFEEKEHSRPDPVDRSVDRLVELFLSTDTADRSHRRLAETDHRPDHRRRMALTRSEIRIPERELMYVHRDSLSNREFRDSGGKTDLSDPPNPNDATKKLFQTTGLIRAPSPIPPATDWSQHQPSSSMAVKWQRQEENKMETLEKMSGMWWEKSLETTSGSKDDVEEVEEVSDK